MEADLAAARTLRSTCSGPAWDPSSAAGCPATTRTGMSGEARKNYAVTFPGISDGPLMAGVTVGARVPAMGVTWSGAHHDGSPLEEDSCCRIRCDGDRRLLLPIPTSRGFNTLSSRIRPLASVTSSAYDDVRGDAAAPPCISASRRRRPGTPIRRTSGAVAGRPRAVGDSPVVFVMPFLVQCRVLVDHFFTRSPPGSPGFGPAGTEPRIRACRAERRLRADTDRWSWPGSCLQRLPDPP